MSIRFLAPIRVQFVPSLRSSRTRLYSGGTLGQPVHAASFLRQRYVVFDAGLLRRRGDLRRIVTHELFHFAWTRLGNPRRREWEGVLLGEQAAGARGELGWSAEWRRRELTAVDARRRTQRWREYACESFCDTAAWLLAGVHRHGEFTLAARWRRRRREWFTGLLRFRDIAV